MPSFLETNLDQKYNEVGSPLNCQSDLRRRYLLAGLDTERGGHAGPLPKHPTGRGGPGCGSSPPDDA